MADKANRGGRFGGRRARSEHHYELTRQQEGKCKREIGRCPHCSPTFFTRDPSDHRLPKWLTHRDAKIDHKEQDRKKSKDYSDRSQIRIERESSACGNEPTEQLPCPAGISHLNSTQVFRSETVFLGQFCNPFHVRMMSGE
ncbi:hypothetical protein, partial [Burkholderia ubonensis]|uniref:hypothetical protein n=1 Tax=Burkholderia ubonensis TaxID=101571 RepID=UPI001E371765